MNEQEIALHNALNKYGGRLDPISTVQAKQMCAIYDRWNNFFRQELKSSRGTTHKSFRDPRYKGELFESFRKAEGLGAEISLDQIEAGSRPDLSECVELARRDLKHGSGSIFDWPPMVFPSDDDTFAREHPGHPCCKAFRFTRQKAADFFSDLVLAASERINDEILEELHGALFDRDPAVRLQVARTLGNIHRPASVAALQRLHDVETESDSVRAAAAEGVARCERLGMDG